MRNPWLGGLRRSRRRGYHRYRPGTLHLPFSVAWKPPSDLTHALCFFNEGDLCARRVSSRCSQSCHCQNLMTRRRQVPSIRISGA